MQSMDDDTMRKDQKSIFSRLLSKQWSFFWAGIVFGLAQVIYMIGLWGSSALSGKSAALKPIRVTTDLGKMFRGLEVAFYNLFALPDFEIYGKAIDGVAAAGGAFVPGVGWPIVGMMIGGWLVARAERESRTWAHYPAKILVISFLGGILFSYGTRLAGGCTLNHLLGGIPLLNIHSFVTALFMAVGGALAFMVLSKVGMASYFKHQETLNYAKANDHSESCTYVPGYNPYLPMIGIIASWVVMLGFIVFVWFLFDVGPGFAGKIKYQTTVGNLIGGVLLGAGAVMLIGCEIRSYMRIGMGYLNTWVGFMGFAIGYLPFTLFYSEHKAFLKSTLLVEDDKFYDLVTNDVFVHKIILGLWWVALIGLLVFFIKLGSRTTGAASTDIVHPNTEDLQTRIDETGKAHGGKVAGVNAPQPVPPTAVPAE